METRNLSLVSPMSLALCQLQYATLSLLHYATCIMSLTLCLLHYASYIMHLALCLLQYASCIMPLALCLLHYASCNIELIGSKEQSPTLKSLDPQYPRKQIIISRNLRRTRKRKFPERLKNVKCFIFESGNTKNPSQTTQDIFVSTIISYCLTNKFFQDVNEFPNHIHQS